MESILKEKTKYPKRHLIAHLILAVFLCGTSVFAQKFSKGLHFDHASGFYDIPFTLTVITENPDANLLYTIDGSDPLTSSTAFEAQSVAQIRIDPANDSIRAATPGFIVRALAVIGDSSISEHVSATYIFLAKVKQQNHPGVDWPYSEINGQHIDLNIDSLVIDNDQYKDMIDDALVDIPTISIVTNIDNLSSRTSGIYVNALNHGKA